jgi:hypothetical protein
MSSTMEHVTSRAARAGGTVVRQVRSVLRSSSDRPAQPGATTAGWLSVTVLRDLADLEGAPLPAPLAALDDEIDVRLQLAPADKGTELSARLRDRTSRGSKASRLTGNDPQAHLRSALREAKQMLEVGEVLAVDPAPHGRRNPTPGGKLLETWTKVAPKGGVR